MASGAKGSGPKGRKDNGDWTFLRAEEAKAVRELLRAVVARDFRSETQAATALGVSQSAVNQVLNENKAPGAQLTDALAEYLRRPIDNIRGRYPCYRDLPGWKESVPDAMRLFPRLPAAAFEGAGNLMGAAPPGEITPATVGLIAQGWYNGASDEVRIETRRKSAEAEMAAEDAEDEERESNELPLGSDGK